MLNPNSDSRRIFFLYPHHETETRIIKDIITNEYEAFLINDHAAARRLLTELNKSLIFVNVDKTLKHNNWDEYIKEIEQINSIQNVMVGTIAKETRKIDPYKSLSTICVSFDNGIDICSRSILEVLEKNNARGKRKYIRAKCDDTYRASFSIKLHNTIHVGIIHDISTFAMACSFQGTIDVAPDTYVNDLQIRLEGKVYKLAGKIIASRNENNLYIVMFDYDSYPAAKEHIQIFIFNALQRALREKIREFGYVSPDRRGRQARQL